MPFAFFYLRQRSEGVKRKINLVQKIGICYITDRGIKMAACKVKPVQPTEIKDKEIALEVINQIRKPIPASVYRRNRKMADLVKSMTKK